MTVSSVVSKHGGELSVAPTATGKSFIGREVVRSAPIKIRQGKARGPHAYLVPFRSLANEVYDHFHDLLGSTNVRLRISTGDYREPIRPEEADRIVATYESFAALVRRTGLAPGTVIADEIHLVEDDHRGPVVEGLLSRLLASGRIASIGATNGQILVILTRNSGSRREAPSATS